MALKNILAKIQPTRPENRAISQDVVFEVDGTVKEIKSAPPEGDPRFLLGTADIPDDGTVTIVVRVTPIDAAGNRTTLPATATRQFTGKDTTPPETPDAPEILEPEDVTTDGEPAPTPTPPSPLFPTATQAEDNLP